MQTYTHPSGVSLEYPQAWQLREQAEALLARHGFTQARVRHFENEARIEVPAEQLETLCQKLDQISEAFANFGFSSATADPEGLVSGKLNRALPKQL